MKILFAEPEDERVVEAIEICKEKNICIPLTIEQILNENKNSDLVQECVLKYTSLRKEKGETLDSASIAMQDPLYLSGMLLKLGYVDACIAGSVSPSSSVLRAAVRTVGLARDITSMSSFFLMYKNEEEYAFSDCAVIENPTVNQLVDITLLTAKNFTRATGKVARVALLSYSTLGSANSEEIDKIQQTLIKIKSINPELIVDGELQFDAAFVPAVHTKKSPQSVIQGDANVFIFPNLAAGNIAYKIAERMGGYVAIGPIVQGLEKPYMDLSRGCSVTDIVTMVEVVKTLG
jgi:phosphate acetyltransferase